MIKITATAPTSYQLRSLHSFGLRVNGHPGGYFTINEQFDSLEDAMEHLRGQAYKYNEEDPEGSDERLKEMYDSIEAGYLELDAVMAHIVSVEDKPEEDEQ
jgi:hypothetical protein